MLAVKQVIKTSEILKQGVEFAQEAAPLIKVVNELQHEFKKLKGEMDTNHDGHVSPKEAFSWIKSAKGIKIMIGVFGAILASPFLSWIGSGLEGNWTGDGFFDILKIIGQMRADKTSYSGY